MKKNYLILIAIVVMGLVFAGGGYLYKSQQSDMQTKVASQYSDALIKPYSPMKGSTDAKVTIVEFLDPACESCRQFYPFVEKLLEKHEGKLNQVIRYAPFHPGSDDVVKILEAARKQGVYWSVLEHTFGTQPYWASHHNPQPELLWKYLEHYKFDVARLRVDMNDPEIAEHIKQDLKDAHQLGVKKTPSFFVNGKPLTSFGYKQLEALVDAAIAEHY